ncbi:MAG: transcription factor S [Candidatus Woesearchaeota archaeon]|jgi:DNA-directed RNA polymerase subunit M|nr:transcription factor S [Candidatus Woesearchaeota archaeon]
MVDFCSNCDAIIIGKKGEEVKCSACGFVQKPKGTVKLSEKIGKAEEIEVINKNDSSAEIHPIADQECPECGHMKAFYWTKQTRAGDEPETQFYKCEKCKHQWREYR